MKGGKWPNTALNSCPARHGDKKKGGPDPTQPIREALKKAVYTIHHVTEHLLSHNSKQQGRRGVNAISAIYLPLWLNVGIWIFRDARNLKMQSIQYAATAQTRACAQLRDIYTDVDLGDDSHMINL